MKIGITAPIYVSNIEHKKYLDLTTRSIISVEHDIVWIPCENYVHPVFMPLVYAFNHTPIEIRLLRPIGKQSVSQAWNLGIDEGNKAGCDFILVINTDIIFKSNAIDRLVDFAVNHPEAIIWTGSESSDLVNLELCPENENYSNNLNWSCFMVKNDFFSHVGKFDENFVPAYCEDSDMSIRLGLAGKKGYNYDGARIFHFGQQTTKLDKKIRKNNSRKTRQCQLYFLEKWGHLGWFEDTARTLYFKHPYNEKDKPLDYWKHPAKLSLYRKFRYALPQSVQYRLILFLNWVSRNTTRG
jgi:GT2 family glycosyltransferase